MMSLLNCYLPLFRLATTLLIDPQQHQEYSVFRSHCMTLLEQALRESELYHENQECEEAFLAVVLYLDECVLCSDVQWVKKWRSELLQMHYFNISVGGEVFFTRLDAIDKTNIELRIVYLFCLLMGFHGRYTQQEAKLLQQRIDSERQCLPENWRQWPNNATLVEQDLGLINSENHSYWKFLQHKCLVFLLPLMIYFLLLTVGLGIFNG